jgi:hypothetical protein
MATTMMEPEWHESVMPHKTSSWMERSLSEDLAARSANHGAQKSGMGAGAAGLLSRTPKAIELLGLCSVTVSAKMKEVLP